MSKSKSKKKTSGKGQVHRLNLSTQTKMILLGSVGAVLLALGGYWAYMTFTTMPPPNIATAEAPTVSQYLGSPRGFARLSHEGRKQFLGNMWNEFSQGNKREELVQAFQRMSSAERQVFIDAAFETTKVDFLAKAEEFNRLPKSKRKKFVENLTAGMDAQRMAVAGYGGQGNLAAPFEGAFPKTTDAMTKQLVTRTSAPERAKAQPLFDAVAAQYKEQEEQRKRR